MKSDLQYLLWFVRYRQSKKVTFLRFFLIFCPFSDSCIRTDERTDSEYNLKPAQMMYQYIICQVKPLFFTKKWKTWRFLSVWILDSSVRTDGRTYSEYSLKPAAMMYASIGIWIVRFRQNLKKEFYYKQTDKHPYFIII